MQQRRAGSIVLLCLILAWYTPSLDAQVPAPRGEGAPLSWRPSAHAVAGNGPPLNWRPSADAVAGAGMPNGLKELHPRLTKPHGIGWGC